MRRLGPGAALLLLGTVCTARMAVRAAGADDEAPQATPAPIAAPEAAAPPAPGAAASLAVRAVELEPGEGSRRVRIVLNRPPDGIRNFALPAPPRLVIDLAGPHAGGDGREQRFPLTDDLVSRARVAPFGGRLRVVLDLTHTTGHRVVHGDGASVIVELGGDAPSAEAAPAAAPPVAAPKRTTRRVARAEPPRPEPVAAPRDEPLTEAPTVSPAAFAVAEPPPAPPLEAAPPAELPPDAAPPGNEPAPAPPAPHVRRHAPEGDAPAMRVATSDHAGFHGERISLDFKDADIQNVLRVIADVSHLNIIATDDVKGRVTLHLVDVPWDQAFDLLLHSNRLEKTQEGNVVRISTVTRLKEEREALRAAQDAERELEPLHVRYIRVNYARADEALVDKVKGVLTDRGSVTFDDRTNTVIVRDITHGVDDASELVKQLDTQSPQVLIEANIVEATEDFARGLGVQWGYQYKAGAATGNPTGANFPGSVGLGGSGLGSGTPPPATGSGPRVPVPFLADFPVPGNFGSGFGTNNGSALDLALGSLDGTQTLAARLTALEEQGKGRVISRPRVVTMNNQAATIQSLTILRVKLPSTGTVINTGAGGAAGTATSATEKINTGITLVVTPQVSQDGYVLMSIFAKSSQPDFTHNVDNIPNEVSREANSNVLIRNGETVVLGGIFRNTSTDNENGIPYLNRVPVLGWLFKRVLHSHHHEELLVFLTPKVIASGAVELPPAERLWQERRRDG